MDNKTTILKKLKEFKKKLKEEFSVNKIIFFGSRVNGKPSEDSDIDLIIVSEKFKDKKFRHRAIGFYDYWDLDYPVDFLCYTPEEFNKLKNQITIVREAVKTGVVI